MSDAVGKHGGLTNYERPNVITLDLESIPSVFFLKKANSENCRFYELYSFRNMREHREACDKILP